MSMLTPLDSPIVCPISIGRAPHLAAADRLVDQLVGGQGQTLLITGEAGIGKSRLVGEIKIHATERGCRVIQSECFETDRALPYAPFLELLRELLPDYVETLTGLDPEQHKRRLFQAITDSLVAVSRERPLLMVIEDVHWADETSLELMRALARTSVQQRLLLVLTFRSDEIDEGLRGLLTALDRQRLSVELRLQRLSRNELDAMLRAIFQRARPSRAEFLDLMHGLTEGNPFFIEEVLRALVGAGDIFVQDGSWERKPIADLRAPRSVEDAVQRRTAQLSPGARDLVQVAAVAGRRFDFELLGALSGVDDSTLLRLVKELIAAGLMVEESADQLAFRHALTRQAIYASLLGRERRLLHRNVAQALEQISAPDADEASADLAYHYAEAGKWQPALTHARRAGERALRLYAPRAAVEQLTRALRAAEALGQSADPELFRLRSQANDLLGEFEAAQADLEASVHAAQSASDRVAEWHALLDLSLLWARRSYERTGAYANQALVLARAIDEPRLIAQTLNRVGNWHANLDQTGEALRHHTEALALFEGMGDERGRAETLDLLGMASSASASRAAGYFAEAIPLLRRLDDRPRLVTSLVMRMLGNAAYLYEPSPAGVLAFDEAQAAADEALRITREIGWPAGEAFVLWEIGLWLGPHGAYRRALGSAYAGATLATEIDHRQWMAGSQGTLGMLHLDACAFDEARRHFETSLALAHEVGSRTFINIATSGLASVALAQRHPAEAAATLDTVLGPTSPMDTAGLRMCWLVYAEARLALEQPQAALDLGDALLASTDQAGVAPRLWQVRGEALAALGRMDEAIELLTRARHTAREQGLRGRLWRIEGSLARLLRGLGRRDEAERGLSAARETIRDLADELDDPSARERFVRESASIVPAATQPTPARAAKLRFGGLTAREREVAGLIARGLSNRGIADQLILGERTIESYVGNILSKLGFTSRTQIAAWVVESGLLDATD